MVMAGLDPAVRPKSENRVCVLDGWVLPGHEG